MDAIGQAIGFGIRVTILLFRWLFELSSAITYKSLGGLYQRSQGIAWAVGVGIWALMWMLILAVMGGPQGALSGLVIGVGWGVFCFMRVRESWEVEMAMMESENPQPPEVFFPPVAPIQEGGSVILPDDVGLPIELASQEPVEKG